jgi:hypothetical protein
LKNIRIFANTIAIYGPVDFRAEVLFFEENEMSFPGNFLCGYKISEKPVKFTK